MIDPIQSNDRDTGKSPTTDAPQVEDLGIVSVNARGPRSRPLMGRVIFATAILAALLIGGVTLASLLSAQAKARRAAASLAQKPAPNAAQIGQKRIFSTDGEPPRSSPSSSSPELAGACKDGLSAQTLLNDQNRPILGANGAAMRVCHDGHVFVPAIIGAAPGAPVEVVGQSSPAKPIQTTATSHPYGGDVLLGVGSPVSLTNQNSASPLGEPAAWQALTAGLIGQNRNLGQASSDNPIQTPAPGSVASLLSGRTSQRVRATKLGDRNMILTQGRTIACGLSMRLISEVSGLASCVVSQDVYSDNGKVILIERGSEAIGEYRAEMAQGQRRLFIIWGRIKTPNGVLVGLNSPASDALGTTGLSGRVENHWWERVGAAFLLSSVKDAVAYKIAKDSSGSVAGTVAYQNTLSTGDQMAARVLDSTINIKPTLYINQGDRGSIYVAHDLDFGEVYELRAQ